MGQSDNCEARPVAAPAGGVASPPIRAMAPGDRPALVGLWIESWREALPAIDFAARRPFIEAFLGDPRHAVLVAAGADGTPLGFAGLAGGILHQLAVAPRAKGGGAARLLVAVAKARHPEGLALDVNRDNPRAVRFYLGQGFAVTGEGRNPTSGLPTLLMRWPGEPGEA